jgi:iron uptake system EfeUOB component EfeO/EfeM
MELSGRPNEDSWFELTEQRGHQVLHDVVQLESKLSNITLPPGGSICYSRDLIRDVSQVSIPGVGNQFCIGPYTGLRW